MVPAEFAINAVNAILNAFRVESFHKPEIIRISHELKKLIQDYIGCVIVATAIMLKKLNY